jgi:hypothetical protein
MKPYALVLLANGDTKFFDHKDEWLDAMLALRRAEKTYLALKFNFGAQVYVTQEIHE